MRLDDLRGGDLVLCGAEILRCERQGFGDLRGGNLMLSGWKFDDARGFGTVQRVRHRKLAKKFF